MSYKGDSFKREMPKTESIKNAEYENKQMIDDILFKDLSLNLAETSVYEINETIINSVNSKANYNKKIGLNRKMIQIGNKFFDAKQYIVAEALFPILCKDAVTLSEFFTQYNMFVSKRHHEELIVNVEKNSNRQAFTVSNKLLWSMNHKMRFYNIDAIDKEAFLERLNLNQYNDVEISTKKIFDEKRELMEEYDIRNEYELHNLLKRIIEPSDCSGLQFCRMPILMFGAADRERQVYNLLAQLTPISKKDFAEAYSDLYGVSQTTFLANYFPLVKCFLDGDKILRMSIYLLSDMELYELKDDLKEDFYLTKEIQELFKKKYPSKPLGMINRVTLQQLGFSVYSGYVIRSTYSSAYDYFFNLLSSDDIIDTNTFPKKIMTIREYYELIRLLKTNYALIEYQPQKYVSSSFLNKQYGVHKEDFKSFCQRVNDFNTDRFFTMQSIRIKGFVDVLFNVGYGNYFYSSILCMDKNRYSYIKIGETTIFSVDNKPFNYTDFLEWLVCREEHMSIYVYELHVKLCDTYGISDSRLKLLSEILPRTGMYYSDITKKVYSDFENYKNETQKF